MHGALSRCNRHPPAGSRPGAAKLTNFAPQVSVPGFSKSGASAGSVGAADSAAASATEPAESLLFRGFEAEFHPVPFDLQHGDGDCVADHDGLFLHSTAGSAGVHHDMPGPTKTAIVFRSIGTARGVISSRPCSRPACRHSLHRRTELRPRIRRPATSCKR